MYLQGRNMLNRTLIIFLPLLLSCNLIASELTNSTTIKQIEAAFETCLDSKPQVNSSLTECASLTTQLWDKELNARYKKLIKTLNPTEETALRNSQRKWMKFRDAEIAYFEEIFTNNPSVSNQMYISEALQNLVKQRALSF